MSKPGSGTHNYMSITVDNMSSNHILMRHGADGVSRFVPRLGGVFRAFELPAARAAADQVAGGGEDTPPETGVKVRTGACTAASRPAG